MADELDVIALKADRPDLGLKAGQEGTIVTKFDEQNFLVEFADGDGVEYAKPILKADEVEVVWTMADHLPQERKVAG
jgi:hypothetical protein